MPSLAIYDAVRQLVTTSFVECPVVWENEEYRPGQDIALYVMAEFIGTYYSRESIGSGDPMSERYDEGGYVIFNILARRGKGSRDAHRIGRMIADLFRGRRLLPDESLEFLDASIGGGEKADVEGAWWMMPVEIEFRQMAS